MNKKVTTWVVLIVLVVAGGLFYSNFKDSKAIKSNNDTLNQQNESVGTASITVTKLYRMSDVVMHDKDGDCWSAVNGKVYDLTPWPAKHPGGDKAIFSICGKDGSEAFNKKHGGQEKPEKTLEGFYIGDLTN